MNKPIIIIDAFLGDQNRINFFHLVLNEIKKLKIPILLISNKAVPLDLQNKVDYFILDHQNILFLDDYDNIKNSFYWLENEKFKYENYVEARQKHGLSVLCNLTKSCDFVKNLGFNKFIHFEWDFLINNQDYKNIEFLINDFLNKNKKAVFLYNPQTTEKLQQFPFHIWMADLDFWYKNYPKIHNEKDYQNFIFTKNNNRNFEIAERVLYLAFENNINDIELIEESFFIKKIAPNSQTNFITSDANFDPPNSFGVFRGLSKVFKNGVLTGELVLFTWNRMNTEVDVTKYNIQFGNSIQNFEHKTNNQCWNSSYINGFDFSKFPITLKTNHGFEKVYKNVHDIKSFLILK